MSGSWAGHEWMILRRTDSWMHIIDTRIKCFRARARTLGEKTKPSWSNYEKILRGSWVETQWFWKISEFLRTCSKQSWGSHWNSYLHIQALMTLIDCVWLQLKYYVHDRFLNGSWKGLKHLGEENTRLSWVNYERIMRGSWVDTQ